MQTNALELFIKERRQKKTILLMTHVIYGYPTIEKSLEVMRTLLDQEVDLLEVQFPFSDPVADGPIITEACHAALENTLSFDQYLHDIKALAKAYPDSRLLIMSYLNPLVVYGAKKLAESADGHLHGIIVPDLPKEASVLMEPLQNSSAAPVWLITPDTSDNRIKDIVDHAQGMLYCVSRKGVTGQNTNGMLGVKNYIARVRDCTELPIGVGFGIQTAADVQLLHNIADVAIVGSSLLAAFHNGGIDTLSRLAAELNHV